MVEFTQREKIIIHSMNIMNNPALKDVPFDLKTKSLQSILLMCGYEWNEDQMIDLMNGIGVESEFANQSTMKMLGKYGHLFKGLKKLS